MDDIIILLYLSLSMLFGSYISGLIPTIIIFSESKLRLLTVFGSGILVGTALSVIIPEGIKSIYTNAYYNYYKSKESSNKPFPIESFPHSLIGVTLVIGFVFMFIIDQIASRNISTYSPLPTVENNRNSSNQVKKKGSKLTATIGLIVHSAADGVALGAAAYTTHKEVEMVIFLAIMLHKAPASFSLVTFLIHEGLDKKSIRKHLLVFSLSAPFSAFLTYALLGKISAESMTEYNATGVAMLFSAGTFLYVATVHVLPELTYNKHLKLKELLFLISGSFLPLFLTVHHHH